MNNQAPHITDEVLVKYLLQECLPEEKTDVEKWFEEDEANLAYYNHFKHIWDHSKQISSTSTIDIQYSWKRLEQKINKPKPNFQFNKFFYYAAAVFILLIASYWYFSQQQSNTTIPVIIVHHDSTLKIPFKQIESCSLTKIKADTLSDKSIVILNKQAKLTHPAKFEGNERRVQLQGEAFFTISPDKKKPFFIETGDQIEIKVLGTSFNVKNKSDYTEIIVETGVVEVRHFNKLIILHPHEKAKIKKNDTSIHVEKNKEKLYRYYRVKEFECENTPLWKLVEVLNEAYDDSISIGNKNIRSELLTTRFNNESLEHVLEIISETFDITVEKQGHHYILK